MEYKLFKVKEGKLTHWRQWCEYLRAHEAEVKETLAEENAVRETNHLFTINGETYVLYGMEFVGTPQRSDQSKELNRRHKETLHECLEFISNGEPLFDFAIIV